MPEYCFACGLPDGNHQRACVVEYRRWGMEVMERINDARRGQRREERARDHERATWRGWHRPIEPRRRG